MVGKYIVFAWVSLLSVGMAAAAMAQQPTPYSAFVVSGDGQEVADTRTGLVWRRCAEGLRWDGTSCTGLPETFNYNHALGQAAKVGAQASSTYRAGQALQGQNHSVNTASDWRLPTVHELSTIVNRSYQNPTTDGGTFPNTPSGWFWSSTFDTTNPSHVWIISFYNGYANNIGPYNKGHVRLVRGALQTASSGSDTKNQ